MEGDTADGPRTGRLRSVVNEPGKHPVRPVAESVEAAGSAGGELGCDPSPDQFQPVGRGPLDAGGGAAVEDRVRSDPLEFAAPTDEIGSAVGPVRPARQSTVARRSIHRSHVRTGRTSA
ncbi:hypothetical protein NP511_21110 [Natrinema thermotolerans]|uniref:Uncharacterized protein n=1 Tax=Natrinema thermotolerans TaxID=121872 RepID=A0AAF0PC78_9EURY|nr:hypothetical protein [Natrinema thermotolerans]WMT07859.1 hypothetical protein NP511_21110 [Natrinema thermotolerans]